MRIKVFAKKEMTQLTWHGQPEIQLNYHGTDGLGDKPNNSTNLLHGGLCQTNTIH